MPKRKAPSSAFKKTNSGAKRIKKACTLYQNGGSHLPVFRAYPLQRGYGMGANLQGGHGIVFFFKNMAMPLLKKAGNYAKNYAKDRLVSAGKNIIRDVVTNKSSVKNAFKKQAKAEVDYLKEAAKKQLTKIVSKVIKGRENGFKNVNSSSPATATLTPLSTATLLKSRNKKKKNTRKIKKTAKNIPKRVKSSQKKVGFRKIRL